MTDEAMSPLRRRMIEDMTIRKFAPKTQHDYVQRVKNFAAWPVAQHSEFRGRAALPTPSDHALAVDVADLERCHFGSAW